MYHIFALIITLQGQPADLLRSNTEYVTSVECELAMPDMVKRLQGELDNKEKNPEFAGLVAVADAVCRTDEDMLKKGNNSI